MPRHNYTIPAASGPMVAGSTVTVYLPNSTTKIPETLFADASSAATLTNPFTTTGPVISFWLANHRNVKIVVTSPQGNSSTSDNTDVSPVSAVTVQAAKWIPVASGGHVLSWAPQYE